MITIAALEERLQRLKKQKERVIADANAITGAIQLIEELITEAAGVKEQDVSITE